LKPALLITGAGGVIGRALVQRLAQDPAWRECRLILTGRQSSALEGLVSGWETKVLELDMADEAGCAAFLNAVPGLGPFKGMALVAGINQDDLVTALTEQSWDRVWAVNVGLHARLIRAAKFSAGASLLLVGSQVGHRGAAGQAAYAAAKGALLDLMMTVQGPRVNLLLPPLVDSPLLENLSPESRARLFSTRLLEDPDPAAGCAEAGAFLLSDAANYIHRQVFHADSRVTALGWNE
jgi:NAD(P)-dependent dehydrogenase (short-subunit alcohol dehydrogenase family)